MLRNDRLRQILVILALAITIIMNVLANTLPLNNQTTGEISNRFSVLVTPAGYVFSIWSLIYIGQIGYAVYQALPAQRDKDTLRHIAPWFILSCAANVGWLLLRHYNFIVWSLVAMFTLLLALLMIALRLDPRPVTSRERWLVHIPFSVYLGWITVATIVNVAVALYALGWDGGIQADVWAIIVLLVGAAIAAAIGLWLHNAAYAAVIVWAYIGIGVEQSGTATVVWAAWLLALIVALAIGGGLMRHHPIRRPLHT